MARVAVISKAEDGSYCVLATVNARSFKWTDLTESEADIVARAFDEAHEVCRKVALAKAR